MQNLAKMTITEIRALVKNDDVARADLQTAVAGMTRGGFGWGRFKWGGGEFVATPTGFRMLGISRLIRIRGPDELGRKTVHGDPVAWVDLSGRVFAWDKPPELRRLPERFLQELGIRRGLGL
jgi:hypothetical protein